MCEFVLILTQDDAQRACPELFYCILPADCNKKQYFSIRL